MKKGLKYSLIGSGLILFIAIVNAIILIGKSVNEFFSTAHEGVPLKIDYREAEDLNKITAVKFPEVIAVDSLYVNDGINFYTIVKFILKNQNGKTELLNSVLERASIDSLYWKKKNDEYLFFIYPEQPIDLPNGTGWRKTNDGTPDWDGDYIQLRVPEKADTIVLEYGWQR